VAIPIFEVPTGVIDGVNTTFTVSSAYVVGSTAVYLNGQLKVKTFLDGWTETDPLAGIITLTEAPLDGDVIQIFYIGETPSSQIDEEIIPLESTIEIEDDVVSYLIEDDAIFSKLEELDDSIVNSILDEDTDILATLDEEPQELNGILEVCEE